MILKLDALLLTRPKSAAGCADFCLQKALKRPQTQQHLLLRPEQCFLELWPQPEKYPLQFGSLRGLDWGPNLVP